MASPQVALASCALVSCDAAFACDADVASHVYLAGMVYDETPQLAWEWRIAHVCYSRSLSIKRQLVIH